jgi:hypothetical protein
MDKPESKHQLKPGYEKRDLNARLIVIVALIALILLAASVYVVDEFFQISKEEQIEKVVLQPVSAQLRELRSHEDEVLSTYQVIDATNGIYQIPIDRAMEILANQAYQNQAIQNNTTGNSKAR